MLSWQTLSQPGRIRTPPKCPVERVRHYFLHDDVVLFDLPVMSRLQALLRVMAPYGVRAVNRSASSHRV